jgi:DNA-binding GntR family transcriptional regulator
MRENSQKHTSLRERAYLEIKEWIIRYDLKPGTHLRIAQLSAELEMSQTPIREALSKLEQESLVHRHSTQGYVVRSMDLKEVEDIYDVRIALEVLAAEEAATRMSKADRKKLSHILGEVTRLVKKGDKWQILKLEQDFHVIIMETSGNRFLTEIGKNILERIWMIQNVNILTSDHLINAHPQHVEIYKALEQANPQKAATLMKKHIQLAKKFVISRLRNSDDVLAKLITGFPGGKRLGEG